MGSVKTKLFALIGDPVGQSPSPAMQNAAFKTLGLNCAYIALRVLPVDLTAAIAGARALGISGFNVTTPHKIKIINLLDKLDESARLVGAVNTIKNDRGKLVGFNTDGEGCIRALKGGVKSLDGKGIVLLGAGGAAHAIAFSAVKSRAELTIANRTIARARALAEAVHQKLGVRVEVISLDRAELTRALKNADILINATTVGMRPNVNETLVTSSMMHRKMLVYDIVYEPIQTRLLREAKQAGAKALSGLDMLVQQGALSFEIWTGRRAPVRVMMAAAKRELGWRSR